ncbi:MAG: hypothetical protein IJC88_05815 [Oscillospiraceae bacterium]|nr:hypothetical protein [Oscillospiraceae bacterium]
MKRKLTVGLALLSLLICLSGCFLVPSQCAVSGCPAESSRYSDYCHKHKCMNTHCNNRAIDEWTYCRACLSEAGYTDFDDFGY